MIKWQSAMDMVQNILKYHEIGLNNSLLKNDEL